MNYHPVLQNAQLISFKTTCQTTDKTCRNVRVAYYSLLDFFSLSQNMWSDLNLNKNFSLKSYDKYISKVISIQWKSIQTTLNLIFAESLALGYPFVSLATIVQLMLNTGHQSCCEIQPVPLSSAEVRLHPDHFPMQL